MAVENPGESTDTVIIDGVEWYNDSASTSPTRGISALNSFNNKEIRVL